jgi:AcrR family transcriptional regulator
VPVARVHKTTRAGVVRAATKIARRDGMDGVTVRAVAGVLDVTPMALYHHVDSAAALRIATLEAILLQIPTAVDDAPPVDRLRTFAVEARTVLRRYPGAADAVLRSWPELVQGCRIMEWLLVTATAVTKRKDRRVDIANGVFVHVLMRVMVERAALAGGRDRTLAAADAHPERFPNLTEVRSRFERLDTDRHFAVGLDALLEGLLRGTP